MFKFKSEKKIILSIGEKGTILSLVQEKTLLEKVFIASIESADKLIGKILLDNLDAPVYILLDTSDQLYSKQILPAVSSFAIQGLIKKKFKRDYSESDIKGARLLGRKTTGRKDWKYLFVSAEMTSLILEWIDYITNLDCSFMGIYMLPLEVENLLLKFNKVKYKDKKATPQWQFFILGNKISGFRQVVFFEEKVVFTRLIPSNEDEVAEVIAGNIEQEIINTIDYLHRLDFSDSDSLDIIAVMPADIKAGLESSSIKGQEVVTFTPYEIATYTGFPGVSQVEDNFADLLISVIFANSKPVLKMNSLRTNRLNASILLDTTANWLFITALPVLFFYMGYLIFDTYSLKSEYEENKKKNLVLSKKLEKISSLTTYNEEDANKIISIINIHNKLEKNKQYPVEPLLNAKKFLESNAYVNSFDWRAEYDSKDPFKDPKIELTFNLSFYNTGSTIEDLFSNFNKFILSVKENYKDMDIENSKLPEQISFGQDLEVIPVQIIMKKSKYKGKKGNKR